MSEWTKTIMGPDLTIERTFQPMQMAMVRLGYELRDVSKKKVVFRKRSESVWSTDNHKAEHRATLKFRDCNSGVFSKKRWVEIDVVFDDWSISITPAAMWAWQEIADKLQVMLSDPAVFLPATPPGPVVPPTRSK